MTTNVELVVAEDEEEAAQIVGQTLSASARAGEEIVLTGGSTPGRAYELAVELESDWGRAGVWWGDERCVPPDDERSNFRMAREKLLDRLKRPPRAVHRIRGEDEPPEAAAAYEREVREVELDLLLLGIGADGHTASLFPNAPALSERERLVVPADAQLEPYVERITLTLPALKAARLVLFLVTGESKADAAARAFGTAPSPETPASLVRSDRGETRAVLDRAAAARLRP